MTIWLDVTTIFNWYRPAVGVVRVETEVARFILSNYHEVYQFCRFDNDKKRYYYVSLEEVVMKLEYFANLTDASSSNEVSQGQDSDSILSPGLHESRSRPARQLIGRSVKVIKGPLISGIITSWKTFYKIKHNLEVSIAKTSALWKRLSSAQSNVATQQTSQEDILHPFAEGDIYISVGMDWEYKDWNWLYAIRSDLNLKTLLCCHDLIPIKRPGLTIECLAERFPAYINSLAMCADKIMCISRSTKNDLDAFLEESGQVSWASEIFYLGTDLPVDPSSKVLSPRAREVIENGRYIMLVSTIERRKGHETVYRAYQRLVDQGFSDLPLLLFVGMPGWGVDDLLADIRVTKRVANHILILSDLSDYDLSSLYRHCLFTVFPSVYEGWGLPVSESLTHGKFCLASTEASIPEAGGDFCEYLDPWDVPLWTERLRYYFTHQSALESREAHIAQNYKPHTWQDAAACIISAAESLSAPADSDGL